MRRDLGLQTVFGDAPPPVDSTGPAQPYAQSPPPYAAPGERNTHSGRDGPGPQPNRSPTATHSTFGTAARNQVPGNPRSHGAHADRTTGSPKYAGPQTPHPATGWPACPHHPEEAATPPRHTTPETGRAVNHPTRSSKIGRAHV